MSARLGLIHCGSFRFGLVCFGSVQPTLDLRLRPLATSRVFEHSVMSVATGPHCRNLRATQLSSHRVMRAYRMLSNPWILSSNRILGDHCVFELALFSAQPPHFEEPR